MLFRSKQDKRDYERYLAARAHTEQREDTRIQRLSKDAKAAGIHTLAALGLPAAGGFAAPVPSGQSSMGDAVADAGRSLAGAFKSRVDPIERERGVLENELLRSQIRQVNKSTDIAIATSRSKIADARNNEYLKLGPTRVRKGDESGAQEVEDRYGHILGEVQGMSNAIRDLWRHYIGD